MVFHRQNRDDLKPTKSDRHVPVGLFWIYPEDVATTAPPTPDYVMGLMRGVIDPELGSDIVELGMAKGATVTDDGWIRLQIE